METKSQQMITTIERIIQLLKMSDGPDPEYFGEFLVYILGQINKPHELCKIAEIVLNFNNLNQEEKVVSGSKLVFSLFPGAVLNAAKVSGEYGKQVLLMASKVEKAVAVPQPVIFSKGPANLPKDSKNLTELSKKFQEVPKSPAPKPQVLNGTSKTFTQTYNFTKGPAALTSENLAQKSWFLGEIKPPYFTEKSTFTIPSHKADTFMGSAYKSYKLNQDALLYRVGNSEIPLGEYYTFTKPKGTLGEQIDRGIPQVWPGKIDKNIVDTAYSVSVPKDSIVHVGLAAPQGGIYVGGTQQIYIFEAWAIPGIKVVEKYPLKEAYRWKQKVKK